VKALMDSKKHISKAAGLRLAGAFADAELVR
jgi:hypothetical protein